MSELGKTHRKSIAPVSPALVDDLSITDGSIRHYAHMFIRFSECGGENFEGRKSMAEAEGVNESTISRRTGELEHKDWVVVVERDFDSETGQWKTPFYHVFEEQRDARLFREIYTPDEGERIRPKPEKPPRQRKSRNGVGGRPKQNTQDTQVSQAQDTQVSSNRSILTDTLSAKAEGASVRYLRTLALRSLLAALAAQKPRRKGRQLTEIELAIGEVWHTEAWGYVGKIRKQLEGRFSPDDSWYAYNITPAATSDEVRAFGAWWCQNKRDKKGKPLALPGGAQLQRWFGEFRANHKPKQVVIIERPSEVAPNATDYRVFDKDGNYVMHGSQVS